MKNKNLPWIVLFLALFAACRNNAVVNEATHGGDSLSVRDSLDRWRDQVKAETEEYRIRIRNRIDEMQRDIENMRARSIAEKNRKKQREYELQLEQRESSRQTLQEKLDRMDGKAEANWKEFKRDVDDFFSRDRNLYNNYGDSINRLKEQK